MATARELIDEVIPEMKEHKDYAQELHSIAKVLKSTEDTQEEYRDWENFPDGEIQTKIIKAINPLTRKPFTVAEKSKIVSDCQTEITKIRLKKPQ